MCFLLTEKAKLLEIPYAQVLNKLLPSEIRIIAWAPVDQEFDARFNCLNRTYKYYFPVANVDVGLMNHAAQKFVGKHDFRNFCKMDVANGVVAFERELISCTVQKNNLESCNGYEMCELVICGSAFLWHQVRCMAAVLLMIGQKLEKSEVIDWMLNIKQCPRRPQYNMASEVPLVLYDSCYEKLLWKHEPDILEALLKDFQAQWTTHTIKARVLTSLIGKLDDAAVITQISDERDKAVTWSDIRQPQFYQLSSLVPFQVTTKVHKPLMKRATHESFESKLEIVNAKRRKVGKEEFSEKSSNTDSIV